MSVRRALDVIEVQNPCGAAWEQMAGDERRRFCTHCQKFVHDLSELAADQAERLICESGGNLCARFARDPQTNRIITLDYQPSAVGTRSWAITAIVSVLAAIGITGAAALLPARTMGRIANVPGRSGPVQGPKTLPTSNPSPEK